jgi:LuxR family maltose regulon positive regulatory protein
MFVLATKLHIPAPRAEIVSRLRLLDHLKESLDRKLTIISAPAGFGKTTLVSEWADQSNLPVAWISLDTGDSDPIRFLTYLASSLQTIQQNLAEEILKELQYIPTAGIESALAKLLNEINGIANDFILVLDDYHTAASKTIDHILNYLLDHLPSQMHLIITTRKSPHIALNRLRVRNQLIELRAEDLRFTSSEAAEFLNKIMGLNLSEEDIAALENRTEGWVAGLQLAAISMKGHHDTNSFIKSFSGSNRYVLDYLLEEVFEQQPKDIQTFLLYTSVLDRMCGALCNAVVKDSSINGQKALEQLEKANLFTISLDHERRWYRYHHLFATLLRQKLEQRSLSEEKEVVSEDELHRRASEWYESNGFEIEAFQHAIAANDIKRAACIIEGDGVPLYFRGAVALVFDWLKALPTEDLNENPSLWAAYASLMLVSGQITGVDEKLMAAEAAIQGMVEDEKLRDLKGRIYAIRATVALYKQQFEAAIDLSNLSMEYLSPNNTAFRAFTKWKLGYAYFVKGDRVAAIQSFSEAISVSNANGDFITLISATEGLAAVQEADNQLNLAKQTYTSVLQMAGDMPLPVIRYNANLGLCRIFYQWNELETAEAHMRQCAELASKIENIAGIPTEKILLARLKMAKGDISGASLTLTEVEHYLNRHNIKNHLPEVTAMQIEIMIRKGNLEAATRLAGWYSLPHIQAKVNLAKGDSRSAIKLLKTLLDDMESKGWEDERLKVMISLVVALDASMENENALKMLAIAMSLAEPNGFVRIFVDQGAPMARLLSQAAAQGIMRDYSEKLLAAFESEWKLYVVKAPPKQVLNEPLSQREMDVLKLVAQGLSNQDISDRLAIALDTVKGHNRSSYSKLQAKRRTEAIAKARELGLI